MATDIDTDDAEDTKSLRSEIAKLRKENESLQKLARSAESEAEKLSDQLRETRAEARDRRHEAKELQATLKERDEALAAKDAELAETLAGFGELDDEYTTFKTQVESGENPLKAQLAELSGKLRKTLHERMFEKVAKELNVTDPVKFADLMELAKYTPEDDEPNVEQIKERFSEVVKGRSWLVDAVPAVTDAAATTGQANATTANGTSNGQPNGQANGTQANGHTSTANGNGTATSGQAAGSNGKPGPGADRGSSLASTQTAAPSGRIAGRI